jgi:hypothetical protein
MRVLACLLLVLTALAGCGGSTPAKTTTTGSRDPAPTDSDVSYTRSGGFIGVEERLQVRPDGAIRVATRAGTRRARLTPAEQGRLRTALSEAGFAHLKSRYGAYPPAPDTFELSVAVGRHRVQVLEAGNPPPGLDRLLALLGQIVARYGPS